MRLLLIKYWERLRSSFWFVPSLMATAAVILAVGGVALDPTLTAWLSENLGWEFNGAPEGGSAVLGTIAGSMINIAGVVFSMTLVALSLASSQLGPRLLRGFMRDTKTQVVLGTFVATFVYCLLVLRTIRRAEEFAFVPHLSIALGVVLAVASVGVLIYFIHHVSVSIQANEIAARIGHELIETIEHLFPEADKDDPPDRAPPTDDFIEAFNRDAVPVNANRDGYLQLIDKSSLVEIATEEKLLIQLQQKPGNFIVAGCPLVTISPGPRVSKEIAKRVHAQFVMGHQRTSDQDVEFAVNQLVEMAIRALSPGINDPFTAIACLDHLGAALSRLAARNMPRPYRYDDDDQLRLIANTRTFCEVVDAALNQIRQYGRTSVSVTVRLLDTIAVVMEFVHRPEDHACLIKHAEMIVRGAREALPEGEDLQVVEERWQKIICR